MAALNEPMMVLDDIEVRNRLGGGAQRREEFVGYYRKPAEYVDPLGVVLPYREPKWITVADTQPLKKMHYVNRGWIPLPQFGRVEDTGGDRWRPILTHRDGPSAFPVEQVVIYRWYDRAHLPGSLRGADIYFPQLVGVEIEEFPCPDCSGGTVFLNPLHLARHLVNKHGYDRSAIIALGTSLGINFQKSLEGLIKPRTVSVTAREAAPERPLETASQVTVRQRKAPSMKDLIGAPEEDVLGGHPHAE